ncbi:hypothetical protein ACFY1A_48245 [Streptomyces sp. NPDC001520]|uniref:hypothetical protein n=1 Tax=Streptomyces sp. NPDC001520 TaxID=3364581 RepID=UPI003692AEAA
MANTRKLDREIAAIQQKLAAVGKRELWPLKGSERRAIVRAAAAGAAKVARGKSPARADRALENAWADAATRLQVELKIVTNAREQVITEAAAAQQARGNRRW